MLGLILTLALQAHAENWFPFGKSGATTTYADRFKCEEAEAQQCYDVSACSPADCVVEQIDDPTKPLYLKQNVQACQAADCKPDLASLVCVSGTAIIAADYATVYCAVPNGFQQMPGDRLVPDQAKVQARVQTEAAAADRAAKVAAGLAQADAGRRIIAFIKVTTDAKNLGPSDALALQAQLQPILGALQLGALPTAKAAVQALKPGGPITQADLDQTLAQFSAEGY